MITTALIALATGAMALAPAPQQSLKTRAAMTTRVPSAEVTRILAGWLAKPSEVARKMIAKYGQPHEATESRLVWWGNGPWKYTVLTNEEIDHRFPMPHKDMLRQVIDYKVPWNKVDDLAAYDGSVIFDRTPGELSARCDKEEANFLAINLSHDIVTGKRTMRGARIFYAAAVKGMMKGTWNNEQRNYMTGFAFTLPREGSAGFKDKPHKM